MKTEAKWRKPAQATLTWRTEPGTVPSIFGLKKGAIKMHLLAWTVPNKPLANNMKTQYVVKAITDFHKEGTQHR